MNAHCSLYTGTKRSSPLHHIRQEVLRRGATLCQDRHSLRSEPRASAQRPATSSGPSDIQLGVQVLSHQHHTWFPTSQPTYRRSTYSNPYIRTWPGMRKTTKYFIGMILKVAKVRDRGHANTRHVAHNIDDRLRLIANLHTICFWFLLDRLHQVPVLRKKKLSCARMQRTFMIGSHL